MIKGDVLFKDKDHLYFDEIGPLESVSAYTLRYYPKFDVENTSLRMSFKELFPDAYDAVLESFKYDDKDIIDRLFKKVTLDDQQMVQAAAAFLRIDWEENGILSSEQGTEGHDLMEEWISARDWIQNPWNGNMHKVLPRPKGPGYDNKYVLEEILKEYKCNFYSPEAMVVDKENRRAGQMDKLWATYVGQNEYSHIGVIGDYKTDKQLSSYASFSPKTFKPPFEHIPSDKRSYYTFKMHNYRNMCIKIGLPIEFMYIYRIPRKGQNKFLRLKDYIAI